MKKLSISLVTYNSERYLTDFCDSLRAQTFKDWDLIVVDNGSGDKSIDLIRSCLPQAKISRQVTNIGFSKAHNLGIAWSASPYVLIINPDIVLKPDCLEILIKVMDKNENVGSIGPKLLAWDNENYIGTETIDSCGLEIYKNYKVVDRYQGKINREMSSEYVFGNSGAFVVFRRSALDQVKVPRQIKSLGYEFFDEDFFAYKEDVDLAWRLILAGWKNYFCADAVAYHQRTVSGVQSKWKDRKSRAAINRYSYRNHWLTILKNHYWPLTLANIFSIVLLEVSKFFYLFILDRSSLSAWGEIIAILPEIKRKRKYIIKTLRRTTAKKFKPWLK